MILHRLSPTVTLYHGDCRDALRRLPDNSVDAVPCDPPYELNFMGKGWDDTGIANDASFWAEVFRVLKPGGHLAAFSASRTYHRMACAIEDAGFEIRDSLMWLYGTGFPKSQNVALAMDKQAGLIGARGAGFNAAGQDRQLNEHKELRSDHPDHVPYSPISKGAIEFDGFGTALKPAFEPIVLARKPLGTGDINVRRNVENGIRSRGWIGEIKWLNESAECAGSLKNPKANSRTRSSAGTSVANVDASQTTNIVPPTAIKPDKSAEIGTSSTGTSIAPPASVDMTNCANRFSNVTGENVHAVPSANPISSHLTTSTAAGPSTEKQSVSGFMPTSENGDFRTDSELFAGIATGLTGSMELVRIKQEAGSFVWPENLPTFEVSKPLTVAANVLRWRTGALNIDGCRIPGAKPDTTRGGGRDMDGWGMQGQGRILDDGKGRWPANVVHDGSDEVVGAFPNTAPSKAGKRNAPKTGGTFGDYAGDDAERLGHSDNGGSAARFFYSAKASKQDRNGSKHPTVKPIALMAWLARLITPPQGTILDPFAGSGTTGAAARQEGFRAILCEREAEYVRDIRARFATAARWRQDRPDVRAAWDALQTRLRARAAV